MLDPKGDDGDMPEDNDSTYSDVGKGDGESEGYGEGEGDVVVAGVVVADGDGDNDGKTREDEDSSDDFFDATLSAAPKTTSSVP